MRKKSSKIGPPGVGKLRKMGARGAFQMQQNTKLKKIGVVPNSSAPFLAILVENGSQDGGRNPLKINASILYWGFQIDHLVGCTTSHDGLEISNDISKYEECVSTFCIMSGLK